MNACTRVHFYTEKKLREVLEKAVYNCLFGYKWFYILPYHSDIDSAVEATNGISTSGYRSVSKVYLIA